MSNSPGSPATAATAVAATSLAQPPPARSKGRSRTPLSLLLLLPAFALVVGLLFYPIADIVGRSLEGGLGNYRWVVGNSGNRMVFATTLETAALVTLCSVLVAYPYAYALTIAGRLAKTFLLIAVLVPFWTSLMIRSFSWVVIFQQNGVLNGLLAHLGLHPDGLLGSTPAVLIGMTHVLMPFAVLPLYAVMVRIDRRLVLAAQSLGANPVAAFVKVFLPLSLRGVASGALLVFVLAMGFFITPALLGSPSNTMASVLIQSRIGHLLDFSKGGALAGVLLLLTLAVLLLGALLMTLVGGRPTQGGSRG
jgi:putative spermidine/putrescine transport system permease protein